MNNSCTGISKTQLRRAAKAKRSALSETDEAASASHAVVGHLLSSSLFSDGCIISGYWPLPGECDIRTALLGFMARGHRIVLPAVERRSAPLAFRLWEGGKTPMEADLSSVPTPAAGSKGLVPEVVLVPALAFDRLGGRLGFGAGYYDRSLQVLRADNPDLMVVGICFAVQEVDCVPMDAHDQPLDIVVTEHGILRMTWG